MHYNDAIREQERVHTAQKYIEILSDSLYSSSSDDSLKTSSSDSSDSSKRQNPTKPMMLYNKSSTFLTKHKFDNEGTPMKQPTQDAFTLKQEILERIKRLHIKCGFFYTEHLFVLPKNWFDCH